MQRSNQSPKQILGQNKKNPYAYFSIYGTVHTVHCADFFLLIFSSSSLLFLIQWFFEPRNLFHGEKTDAKWTNSFSIANFSNRNGYAKNTTLMEHRRRQIIIIMQTTSIKYVWVHVSNNTWIMERLNFLRFVKFYFPFFE